MTASLKFGTSGLRGLVSDLDGSPAYLYARAFAGVVRGEGARTVLIGRDLRASSPRIAARVAAGVRDAGLEPIDCGAVPTPALALAAMGGGHAAIMVTGSHIPEDRNGLKFYRAGGEIGKADEAPILARHAALGDVAAGALAEAGASADVLAPYCRRFIDFFRPGALAGRRVGVYQHSSVGRDLIVDVLGALGAEAVALGRAERFIPVDTEALRPEDEALAAGWAAAMPLDAIVSTDGDADRPLVADGRGRFLRGDLVGAITARFVAAGCVVTPVTSNSALDRPGLFGRVVRTRVGSPYVIAGMEAAVAAGAGPVVGFEANGGVLLASDILRHGRPLAALPTRDALLPILAVLVSAAEAGQPVAALAEGYGFAIALSDRLQNIPGAASAAFIGRLETDTEHRDQLFAPLGGIVRHDVTDGLRLTTGAGVTVHFRASGNAPELRVYVEAATPDAARAALAFGLDLARSACA